MHKMPEIYWCRSVSICRHLLKRVCLLIKCCWTFLIITCTGEKIFIPRLIKLVLSWTLEVWRLWFMSSCGIKIHIGVNLDVSFLLHEEYKVAVLDKIVFHSLNSYEILLHGFAARISDNLLNLYCNWFKYLLHFKDLLAWICFRFSGLVALCKASQSLLWLEYFQILKHLWEFSSYWQRFA